jgi:hypothetical protein
MLELYEKTIDKEICLAKRSLPLHRQLKNLYKQKRAFQAEIRKLKAELQPFKEKVTKRNLDILDKVANRRSTRKRQIQDTLSHQHHFFHGSLFTYNYILSNDFGLKMRLPYSYDFSKVSCFKKFVASSGMFFPTSYAIFKGWNHFGGKKAPT